MHQPEFGLLSILVLGLVSAFAGGLAVRALRLPPLLGYILAGIMIGQFTPGLVAKQSVANELAEIGVALLLFNIGLHLSFKDLLSVRRIALPGALVQVCLTTAGGAFLSYQAFHTSLNASLVIGLSLAIASTAVASRVLDESRQTGALAGRVALGWLIVQDIIVIAALVLLPFLGELENARPAFVVATLGKTFLQITGFAAVMIIGGRRFIPALLRYVARIGSRELFTLSVIVVALGIAYASAEVFGVSLTMGAFFAGVVIGESDLNHHAASEAVSMQQVFTILFFVSVGMLLDPVILATMPVQISAFVITVILGTGLLTTALLIWMGVPLQAAALVGAAFSQIGEFSFVLSQIGYKSGLFGTLERDMIMGAAILSILINPAIVFCAKRLSRWIDESPRFANWRSKHVEHYLVDPEQIEGHTILVGHGRVGGVVAQVLRENGLRYIAIEADRTLAEKLRREGHEVVFGDASRESVCAAAMPQRAKLLVLAVPEAYYARQIIRQMRKLNPQIDIVVRTHSDEETRTLNKLGVGLAVMGEREIGFGMATYALFRLGIDLDRTRSTITGLRERAYGMDRTVD